MGFSGLKTSEHMKMDKECNKWFFLISTWQIHQYDTEKRSYYVGLQIFSILPASVKT